MKDEDTSKYESMMGDMLSRRASMYAEIHDDEVRKLLEKNGFEWDGTPEGLHNLMAIHGIQIVIDQASTIHKENSTTKRYVLKLCKLIDMSRYQVVFDIGTEAEQ